jgi:CRISPR/Cas system-associated exonuclease Cas4 (RecB family)
MTTLLTKSKYMNGLQCARLLWFADKKQLPEPSLSDKHKFSQGADVEKYARSLFEGVNLAGLEFEENLEKTKQHIKSKDTIIEAGIQFENYFIRADILESAGKSWNLYEIKATTEAKPEHIQDLAFQKFVCEKAGLAIKNCYVLHLNKEFVKNGEIKAEELIQKEEVTEQVELVTDIEKHAKAALEIINSDSTPPITISPDCNKPHDCALKEECWGTLPKHNVLELTNWRVYWKLFDEGIIEIKDIPPGTKLTAKDETIKEAVMDNEVKVSPEHIKHFLGSLNYPLYHFDFETYDTAVPIFDKSRPYQKITFQFSLHIQQKDGSVKHHEFLAENGNDPRPALLAKMKEVMGKEGDVIVFNQTFEVGRIKELIEDFPEHADWLQNVLVRIKDLALPFQNFYYYNPVQCGKYSIKKVLPAITGKGYKDLEINNGGDASMMFFYSHVKTDSEYSKGLDKEYVRKHLLKYCCLDSEGMVWIVNKLKELTNKV